MMMQLGAEGVFVGSGIFKSGDPSSGPRRSSRPPPSTTTPTLAKVSRGLARPWSASTSMTSAAAPPGDTRLVNPWPSRWRSADPRPRTARGQYLPRGVFNPESVPQRTFGGHIAGQSLVSAVRTVDPRFRCTRCTATSCAPATPRRRSTWSTGPVTAARSAPAGSTPSRTAKSSSRCRRRSRSTRTGIEHQDEMPTVVAPDDLVDFDPPGDSVRRRRHRPVRRMGRPPVPPDQVTRLPGKASQQQVWFKHRDRLPDDPLLHICALAYMSDLTLLGFGAGEPSRGAQASSWSPPWTTRCGSRGRSAPMSGCSTTSPSPWAAAAALTQGKIFTRRRMVAAVMQEA